jgi:hypothetical protein
MLPVRKRVTLERVEDGPLPLPVAQHNDEMAGPSKLAIEEKKASTPLKTASNPSNQKVRY